MRVMPPGPQYLRSRLRRQPSTWRLTIAIELDDMDLLAVLATHADRYTGHSGPDLAPDEVYDRVAAFLLAAGADSVQDTLTLPEEAVGWAQRQLDHYDAWLRHEAAIALPIRRRGRRKRPLAPD